MDNVETFKGDTNSKAAKCIRIHIYIDCLIISSIEINSTPNNSGDCIDDDDQCHATESRNLSERTIKRQINHTLLTYSLPFRT